LWVLLHTYRGSSYFFYIVSIGRVGETSVLSGTLHSLNLAYLGKSPWGELLNSEYVY
jgi:hypothetical protein